MQDFSFLITLNFVPHLTALVIAYLLALPIGWNREREERSAGLRTLLLVAVASCGFIQASESRTNGRNLNSVLGSGLSACGQLASKQRRGCSAAVANIANPSVVFGG